MAHHIQRQTAIPVEYLAEPQQDFRRARVGQRMSWSSDRKTTRIEDLAYCLFGLFDINLPLLYGEGERAFQRLQAEILRTSQDDSILAWSPKVSIPFLADIKARAGKRKIFASSPEDFQCLKHKFIANIWQPEKTWEITSLGLRMVCPIYRLRQDTVEHVLGRFLLGQEITASRLGLDWDTGEPMPIMLLNGALDGNINHRVLAVLLRLAQPPDKYEFATLCFIDWERLSSARRETLYIYEPDTLKASLYQQGKNWLQVDDLHLIKVSAGLRDRVVAARYARFTPSGVVTSAHPSGDWFRVGVQMRTESAEYLVVLEKRDFLWNFWFSTEWLRKPIVGFAMRMPQNSSLEEALGLSYLSLWAKAKERGGLRRRVRQRSVKHLGSCFILFEIDAISAEEVDGELAKRENLAKLPPGKSLLWFSTQLLVMLLSSLRLLYLKYYLPKESTTPGSFGVACGFWILGICDALIFLPEKHGDFTSLPTKGGDHTEGVLEWAWRYRLQLWRAWGRCIRDSEIACIGLGVKGLLEQDLFLRYIGCLILAVSLRIQGVAISVRYPQLLIRGRVVVTQFLSWLSERKAYVCVNRVRLCVVAVSVVLAWR